MNFKNKTILLTGASTGIGKEIAINLAKIDCNLILIARRVELINEYIDALSEEPKAKILPLKCDVSKKNEVEAAYEQIIDNI